MTSETSLALLDTLPISLLEVDDGGRIVLANERAAAFFGVPRGELEGRPVSEVLAPIGVLLSAEGEQGTPEPRLEITAPSGEPRVVGFQATPYVASGGRRRVVVSFQDITELAHVSDERDRLLRLATVAELLPAVLHEVKNPLAAVTTAVEVMLDEESELSASLRDELHSVLKELRRMRLPLDGVGLGARSLFSERAQAVDHTVQEVTRVLEMRASSLGVHLEHETASLPLLHIDTSALRAVLFNLITNALQACQAGDEVRVGYRLIDGGEALELSVRDTGAGMTPETLARCRDLFFTTKPKGSGIGLALVDRLLREAGGSLEIESAPRRGTSVRLRIPTRRQAPRHFDPRRSCDVPSGRDQPGAPLAADGHPRHRGLHPHLR